MEPTLEDTVTVLKAGYVARLEAEYGVRIEEGVPEVAARLSRDCLPNRRLPDKAIDLLDEACATVVIPILTAGAGHEKSVARPSVTKQAVAEVLSEWTGIPIQELVLNS
jgi:ATP-dependent Clp protease ATP-binding subunit ClpA